MRSRRWLHATGGVMTAVMVFRCTPAEREQIEKAARKQKVTVSEYLRGKALT